MGLHMNWGLPRRVAPMVVAAAFVLFSLVFFDRESRRCGRRRVPAMARRIWPEAQALGHHPGDLRRGDARPRARLSLPDLAIPGRPEKPQPGQAEFVQTPADYLKESNISRLAAEGAKLRAQYAPTLDAIEKRFGVPGPVVLAIWGRETDFGHYKLPHDAIRVLATQAYVGKRKDMFRHEFLLAMKMLQEGARRRGHAQFLGRRHGAHPVPAVGILQARRRFRRRRPRRHLAFGARCARLGRQAACRQGLAARPALGL